MNRFLMILLEPGSPVASVPVVFLSVSLVAAFQIPAHLLIRSDMISAGVLVNELIAIGGVPLILIWLLRMDAATLLPFNRVGAVMVIVVILTTLGADVVIDYLTAASEHFFPLPARIEDALNRLMTVESTSGFVWKMVLLCAVPAVCEEVFFRGFCQTSLASKWGVGRAIVVTAVLFAVLHGNPWYAHLYLVLGLLLGWIYAVTGSLWTAVVCHFINNAWTFVNHTLGIEFPLGRAFDLTDAAILAGGAALFVFSAVLLKSRGHNT